MNDTVGEPFGWEDVFFVARKDVADNPPRLIERFCRVFVLFKVAAESSGDSFLRVEIDDGFQIGERANLPKDYLK